MQYVCVWLHTNRIENPEKKKKKLYAVIPPCNHCYKYKMGIKHPGFGVIMLEAHSLLP